MPGGALEASNAEDTTTITTSTTNRTSKLSSSSSTTTSVFVGKKLDDHRGAFILDYPMDKGCVMDGCWDSMEMIWNVSFSFGLYFDNSSMNGYCMFIHSSHSCYLHFYNDFVYCIFHNNHFNIIIYITYYNSTFTPNKT